MRRTESYKCAKGHSGKFGYDDINAPYTEIIQSATHAHRRDHEDKDGQSCDARLVFIEGVPDNQLSSAKSNGLG
jgi:hypothetical protein